MWKIDRELKGYMWPAVTVIAALGLFAVQSFGFGSNTYRFSPEVFPVEAASWAEAHPLTGPMFNDLNWGGYLMYRLWPGQRVFIDSQTDFYGEDFVRKYEAILLAKPGWQRTLDQYNIGWVIIPPGSQLAAQLASSPSWRSAYDDSTASIFVRVMTP